MNDSQIASGDLQNAQTLDSPKEVINDTPRQYVLENLEAPAGQTPVQAAGVAKHQQTNLLTFSKRKAMIISIAITLAVTLVTGASVLWLAKKGPRAQLANQAQTDSQDVVLKDAGLSLLPGELEGSEKSLLINANVVAKGNLKIANSSYSGTLKVDKLTNNRTYQLPDSSGTLATIEQVGALLGISASSSQTVINEGDTIVSTGVTSVNDLAGSLTLQGTANQVAVSAAGGNITLSTPQNLNTTADVTFGNLSLGTSGIVTTNNIHQTTSGNNFTIDAGNDQITLHANGIDFILPTTGISGQTICTTGISCAEGGGQAVLLASGTSAQMENASFPSIFINDTGGGNLIQLQEGGVDKFAVTSGGNATIGGSLTLGNALTVANGGTGLTGYTTGDLLYASGASSLSKLAAVASGQLLVSNGVGVAPSWSGSPSLSGSLTIQGSNSLTLGTASSATGSILFKGASSANTLTLIGPASPSTNTLTLPNETGTICSTGSLCAGYAAGSGSNNYIQNQSGSDQTADFRISGTGRANTSFLTALLDTPSSATLSIGTTNASAITLGSSSLTGTITLGQSTATNTISIGSANTANGATQTINIGTGTAVGTGKSTIIIGNAATNSSITLQAPTILTRLGAADDGNGIPTVQAICRNTLFLTLSYCDNTNHSGVAVLDGGNFISGHNLVVGTTTNGFDQNLDVGLDLMTSGVNRISLGRHGGVTVTSDTSITGNTSIMGTSGSSTTLNINTGVASNIGLVVQGASSQTANLLQVQDSTTANLFKVSAAGNVGIQGNIEQATGYFTNPFGGVGKYQNLLQRSVQLNVSPWAITNISMTGSQSAPDGSTNALKLTTTGAAPHTLAQPVSHIDVSGVPNVYSATNSTYTFSMWLRSSTAQSIDLRINNSGSSPNGTPASYTLTNNWTRYSVTQTVSGCGTGIAGDCTVTSILTLPTAAGVDVTAWGAQLAEDSAPGVYVATGTIPAYGSGQGVNSNGGISIVNQSPNTVALHVLGTGSPTVDYFNVQSAGGTNLLAVDKDATVIIDGRLTSRDLNGTGGNPITIQPGSIGTSATGGTGAALNLLGGSATAPTGATGGAVNITGGAGSSTGGSVNILAGTGTSSNGAINIGSVGSSNADSAVHIADSTGSGTQTVRIGSDQVAGGSVIIKGGSQGTGIQLITRNNGAIAIGSNSGAGSDITIGNILNTATHTSINGGNSSTAITLSTATGGTIQIGQASSAITQTINVGNNADASAISTVVVGSTSTSSALTLQSGTGNIAILTAASSQINIGTNNVASKTINIGSSSVDNFASATTINIGNTTGNATQDIKIGSISAAGNRAWLYGGTGADAISIQAATGGTINVGNSNANSILIGSNTSSSPVTIRSGSGGTSISSSGAIGIGTSTATAVNIGNTSSTVSIQGSTSSNAISLQVGASGTINIGTTNDNTVNIANITNFAHTVNIATVGGSAAQTVTIGANITGSVTSVRGSTLNLGVVGAGTGTSDVHINDTTNGTGIQMVTLGSTANASSATTIQGGSGSSAIQLLTASGGTIGIGNNAVANAVNIAAANGANNTIVSIGNGVTGGSNTAAVTIGSNNAAGSTTLIQGGNGATAIQIMPNDAGAILVGGTTQTGAITVGQSTASNTITIGSAAGNGNTQTINIGTSATAGSTTNITIGSAIAGTVTIKSVATFEKAITVGGHVISANTSGTTTVAADANCGAGCSASVSGNDTSGVITINTGTGAATGTQATITFANAYGVAPVVVITPETVPGSSNFPQYHYTSGTTTFDLRSYNALSDSVTYKFSYHVIQ